MLGKRVFLISLLILISLCITFFCQKEALFNRYVVEDDANAYVFPFYKIRDPQLFQNDFFTEFSLRYNSRGTVFIYGIFTRLLDPLVFSKILPFILCCLSAIFFFLVGEEIQNIFVGFLSAVIFIMHSWTFHCFSGGHAKAFAFLLLSSFIYFLLKKRFILLTIILFLQIFIYPPMAVISIFSLFILLVLRILERAKDRQRLNKESIFFVFLIIFGFLSLFFLYWVPDNFRGRLFNFKEIVNMPEFHYGGRDPHFIKSLEMLRRESIAENIIGIPIYSFPTWFLLGIASFGLFLASKRKMGIAPILNIFCLSGFFLFILAWVMFFNLFSPGRYIKFSLTLYLVLLSALTVYRAFVEKSNRRKYLKLFLITAIIILIYFPFLNKNLVFFRNEGLYRFLSTLPKDVLIAGHPYEMNEIPLFSKRKVFVQHELALPYYKNYYQKIKERIYDFFKLYYSSSPEEVKSICRQYKIEYIVIKKEHFDKDYLKNNNFYTNPFNDVVKQTTSENVKKGFVFANIAQRNRVYEDDKFMVFKISDLAFSYDEF